MNKKLMLLTSILIGVIFILPLISAITLNVPTVRSNSTGTINFNCTRLTGDGPINASNASIWYNSSGGAVSTMLAGSVIANTSVIDTHFYATGIDISSFDGATVNITCRMNNGSSQNSSAGVIVTFDSTNPVTGLTLDTTSPSARGPVNIVWSSSDATSGVKTVSAQITSPDTARCPIINYTDTTGTKTISGEQTKCTGTYTVLEIIRDHAGNTATLSKTFKTFDYGLTKSGSNTLGGSSKSQLSQGQEINSNSDLPLGETGTKIAIFALLGLGLWYFFKKK